MIVGASQAFTRSRAMPPARVGCSFALDFRQFGSNPDHASRAAATRRCLLRWQCQSLILNADDGRSRDYDFDGSPFACANVDALFGAIRAELPTLRRISTTGSCSTWCERPQRCACRSCCHPCTTRRRRTCVSLLHFHLRDFNNTPFGLALQRTRQTRTEAGERRCSRIPLLT